MDDRVSIAIEGGVADVRMVRTDKMNALDNAMFDALVAAGERLKTEKGVRAVVLSGEGRAFCAGLDMGNFGRMADGPRGATAVTGERELGARTHGVANRAQYACWVWREVPVPVIAAVHGVAFGGGFQVALGADMRYVTPDARLAVMEIKWGPVPDMAGTQLMRVTWPARTSCASSPTPAASSPARKRCSTASPRASAPIPGPRRWRRPARSPRRVPTQSARAKRILNDAVLVDPKTGLTQESVEQGRLIGSPNQVEAVMSNLQKRPAIYTDA